MRISVLFATYIVKYIVKSLANNNIKDTIESLDIQLRFDMYYVQIE